MTSCAWLWLYVGAFLMLAELLLPGFVVFFFGLSAATVGLLRFALGESFTLTWQLAAFSAFTILYLAVLRRDLAADEHVRDAFGHERGFFERRGVADVLVVDDGLVRLSELRPSELGR